MKAIRNQNKVSVAHCKTTKAITVLAISHANNMTVWLSFLLINVHDKKYELC